MDFPARDAQHHYIPYSNCMSVLLYYVPMLAPCKVNTNVFRDSQHRKQDKPFLVHYATLTGLC